MTKEIEAAVLDYFEGWHDGDVTRMERALHPDLLKRSPYNALRPTTRERMLELTAAGAGAEDAGNGRVRIEVHDVWKDIANATVTSAVYREYVQLVRTDDGWKITNTLWQLL
jgi:hypothetical protein